MAERFWPRAKASIILLPSGEQGEALLALAGEWTKMGLLAHALWVLPESVQEVPTGPPRIEACVLGVGHDLEIARIRVDLFEALAREALRVVRLVKLRSAAASRELDAEQDAIAERVRDYVRKSMPMPSPTATILEQPTELRHATLICAPTEFELQQRVDWASGEYGAVVVASPEDRSSPWSGDAFVRENDRFVGFTLMHLASVAGLWNGVGTSSFELFRREESAHQSVWLSRVFVNAVLTESLGRRTAARVLEEAARPESLLVDPSVSAPPAGTAFIQDNLVAGYIDDMVRGTMTLDDAALAFRPPPSGDDPQRRRVGFLASIGGFFVFSGEKLVRMPYWAWRWITSRASRRLTRALYSDEGATVVGREYDEVFDVRDRMLLVEAARIAEHEKAAKAQANAPAGLAHVRTTPRLWARLRELVFGSLDGSADLSDLGFAAVEGNVPVFGRVSDVLALPGEPWTRPPHEVPPGFPERVDWYALALEDPRERLEDWVTDAAERRVRAEVEIAQLTGEIEALQTLVPPPPVPAPAADPAPRAAEGASPAADPASPAAEGAEPASTPAEAADTPSVTFDQLVSPEARRLAAARAERDRALRDHGQADTEHTARSHTLDEFNGWAASQDRSFVWRLLTCLSEERRSAERLSAELSAEIARVEAPAAGELLRLRRGFHRAMLTGWSVGVVLVGLAVLGVFAAGAQAQRDPAFDAAPWQAALWTAIAVVTGVVVVLTFGALIRYHVGWSRFQRRIDLERARLARLGTQSRHARQEATRLSSLHRQTVDWLVLLSRAIHRPWHVPEQWMQRQSYEVARGAMPFALQIATVQDDDYAATARMRGIMTDQLVVRGWRHAAFESLVREVALDRGALGGSFGLVALDEDLPHSSNHTRRMLLAALDDEAVLTRVAGPRLEELVKTAQRDDLHGGRPLVTPVGDNPLGVLMRSADPLDRRGDEQPWDDFLLGSLAGRRDPVTPLSATVLAELEVGERHHERVHSYVVLPQRLAAHLDFDRGSPVTVVPFGDAGVGPVDLSWRVDIAGPVPQSAVRLWSGRGARRAAAPATPAVHPRDPDDTGV
ncbi:MAG: hypothetical protein QM602_04825 [Microbacterium sp.]